MNLFFDTETTGFFKDWLPVDDSDQPHIVQLAAQLCEDDGTPVSSFSFIIDPGVNEGVSIPDQASNVHGITNERAFKFGISPELALSAFGHLYQRCDLVCAHNIKFDKAVMETAIARHHKQVKSLAKPLFCTMEAASPIVNLPPTDKMIAAGFNKPKPPKLEECIQHFFNEDLAGAHDAMVDVEACRRVYLHLKSLDAS